MERFREAPPTTQVRRWFTVSKKYLVRDSLGPPRAVLEAARGGLFFLKHQELEVAYAFGHFVRYGTAC